MTDIEQIVAEVVRRLMQALPADATFVSSEPEEPKSPTTSLASLGGTSGMPIEFARKKRVRTETSDVLKSEEKVLSLSTLEGKLEGVRRLVVHRKAIVTPALKEELSRRGIELDRGGLKGNTKSEASVAVVRFDAAKAPLLQGIGLTSDVTVKSLTDLAKKTQQLATNLSQAVLVLTTQATATLCVLNRSSTIRAALVSNVDTVRAAAKTVAANVFVVDPRSLNPVQLAAMVRAIENESGRSIPVEVRQALA